MDQESIKNLPTRQKAQKIVSMDRRSCRECVEHEPRNLDGLRSCQDSIEKKPRNLDGFRSCRDAIEKVESVGKIQDGSRNC